ncbi:type IV toxin-antitoxin system AbiEi family antitoxin domain-containing protein [Nocardioides sp. cx-173]|uniref:type IV toxin-antitoxin system AbiEi family antitoxin domain-containing protein n=1 Tax=Nocardioides sp. cx-173 TaxID=2898796 RepID=UPI001E503F7E|nr:type IV toxin-antitoxin system AbiEi family antitoxin domain-containing protein [Nocardioides sp. cx-173]MCD4525827.1 type IV toxin-antitoxin system AbiEi family antitoxin domain-containing protein [Nocardioides sp. cx-173]UGB39980.1 type IV toxin-antitoxin system AbiEi family antitoxin domain-containing protein [Nocardioides sp. cx-173]
MRLPTRTRPADHPRNAPLTFRRDLIAQGLDDRAIARLVKREGLVKVRVGTYAPDTVWTSCDQESRYVLRGHAVLGVARTPVVLSHTSALAEWDVPLWGFDLSTVHTTRTDGLSGRRGRDINQHEGRLGPGDLRVVNNVPVMTPARAVLESATLASTEAALCAANDVLHRRLATAEQLHTQYVGMENWPGSIGIELVLRLSDARIETVGESRTFWCCYQQGLPCPVPQYEIRDEWGRVVWRVDFAWPELGVFVEFDGWVKYEKLLKPGERTSDVVIRERDREREICRLTGWRCIRVTWSELADPARLAARIRRELFPMGIAS